MYPFPFDSWGDLLGLFVGDFLILLNGHPDAEAVKEDAAADNKPKLLKLPEAHFTLIEDYDLDDAPPMTKAYYRDAIQCCLEIILSDLIFHNSDPCSSLTQIKIRNRLKHGNCCHEISRHH